MFVSVLVVQSVIVQHSSSLAIATNLDDLVLTRDQVIVVLLTGSICYIKIFFRHYYHASSCESLLYIPHH